MRTVAVFALLLLGINALPEVDPQLANERQVRIITDQIIEDIENVSEFIRDMGLDPLLIEHDTHKFELPVPVIFNAGAELEDIRSFGLSDIVIEHINLAALQSRLDFHLALPHIHFFAGKAKGQVTLFDETLTAETGGSLDIRNIDVFGTINLRIGLISGISIGNLDIDLRIGQISANMRLAIQDEDYSEEFNNLMNITIPSTLNEFSDEINELLEIILIDLISDIYL